MCENRPEPLKNKRFGGKIESVNIKGYPVSETNLPQLKFACTSLVGIFF